jgi:hypothetical protein
MNTLSTYSEKCMFYRVTDVCAVTWEQSWNITPYGRGCVYCIDSGNIKKAFRQLTRFSEENYILIYCVGSSDATARRLIHNTISNIDMVRTKGSLI